MSATKTHAQKQREREPDKPQNAEFDLECKIMAPPPFAMHIDETADQTQLIEDLAPKDKADEKGTPQTEKPTQFSETPMGLSPLTEKGAKNLQAVNNPPQWSYMPEKIDISSANEEGESERQAAQLKENGEGFAPPSAPPADDQGNGGLPGQLKAGIESLSGVDMSDVQVNRNSSKPAQMKALAVAQGNSIDLAPGQEKHLPHEAWHVAQQKQGRVSANTEVAGNPVNDDAGLEKEADDMGAKAAQMKVDSAPANLTKNSGASSAQLMAAPMQLKHERSFDEVKDVPIPEDKEGTASLLADGIPDGEEVPPEFIAVKAEYDKFVEEGGDPAEFKGLEAAAKTAAPPAPEGGGEGEEGGEQEKEDAPAADIEGGMEGEMTEGGGEGGAGEGGGEGEGGNENPNADMAAGGEEGGANASPAVGANNNSPSVQSVDGAFGAGKEPANLFVINKSRKEQVGDGSVLEDLGSEKYLAAGLAASATTGDGVSQLKPDGDPPQQIPVPQDVTKESLQADRDQNNQIVKSFQESGIAQVKTISDWNTNLPKEMETKAKAAKDKVEGSRRAEAMKINLGFAAAFLKSMGHAAAAREKAKSAYETTKGNIETWATGAKTKVETAFTTANAELDTLSTTIPAKITETLETGKKGMIDAATAQGELAKAHGEQRAVQFEAEPVPSMGFWDKLKMGPWYEHRKRSARANAARKTGEGFADSFMKTAQEEAAQFDGAANQQLQEIATKAIADARTEITTAQTTALADIEKRKTDDLAAALDAFNTTNDTIGTQFVEAVKMLNTERGNAITSLTEGAAQVTKGIDTQMTQMTTALSATGSEAVTEFTRQVNEIARKAGEAQDPTPAEVQAQMDKALAGVTSGVAGVVKSLNEQLTANGTALLGIADSGITNLQGITTGAKECSDGLAAAAKEMMDEQAKNLKDVTLTQLEAGSTASFTAIGDGVSKFITDKATETGTGLETVLTNLANLMTENATGLTTDFAGQITNNLDTEIDNQAREAAEAVPSIYAIIVSWAIKILIAIVITAICCALLASGVGLLAVVLVGAVLGAVGGAITYGVDCGLGLQEFSMGGLGMAMASGALSGAVSALSAGAGNMAGAWVVGKFSSVAANATAKFVTSWAVETAVGTAIDTVGSGFTEMLTTGNWNLDTFLSGMDKSWKMNLAANGIGGLVGAKLAKSPKFQAFASKLDFSRYFKTATAEVTEEALESTVETAAKNTEIDAPRDIDAPKVEEPKVEAPPKVEEPKVEEPKTEAPKTEEPKTEAPKTEEPKAETPKTEEPKAETPKTEEPKAETPKTEEPKVEEPKVEEPKAETPKTEEPKVEEPKVEEPKAETPKTEEPKVDDPNAPKGDEPEGPKNEAEPGKDPEGPETKNPTGESLRSQPPYNYPKAPDGYHYANINGKPVIKRNPGMASQIPPVKINPVTKKIEVNVDAPRGYHWELRNGKYNVARNPNMADTLPKLDYDPSTGGFKDVETGNPYGGDLTATPARGSGLEDFKASVGGGIADEALAKEAFELFKLKKWAELETLFNTNGLNGGWPPNRGFTSITETNLPVGFKFDRYGGWMDGPTFKDTGTFVAPDGASFPSRALPEATLSKPYNHYEVVKPIPGVKEGPAIPWFGQPGKGMQYELPPGGIDQLIKDGYIVKIEPGGGATPKVETGTPHVDTGSGPKVETDAPKVETDSPKVETDTDTPKVNDDTPGGGMRGKGVYDTAPSKGKQVGKSRSKTNDTIKAEFEGKPENLIDGITIKQDEPGGNTFHLDVDGVKVEVSVMTQKPGDFDALPSVHGAADQGAAMNTVKFDQSTGTWTATVHVKGDADIRDINKIVGHEFNEIGLIVRAENPKVTTGHYDADGAPKLQDSIQGHQEAGVFKEGGSNNPADLTVHDRAFMKEMDVLAREVGELRIKPDKSADEIKRLTQMESSLKKLMDAAGIKGMNDPKMTIFQSQINLTGNTKRWFENVAFSQQITKANPGSTAFTPDVIDHLRFASHTNTSPGGWKKMGLNGGHITADINGFPTSLDAASGLPNLKFTEVGDATIAIPGGGSYTVRKFKQEMLDPSTGAYVEADPLKSTFDNEATMIKVLSDSYENVVVPGANTQIANDNWNFSEIIPGTSLKVTGFGKITPGGTPPIELRSIYLDSGSI